jgi:cyclopropane-fatty-acyl-phospholipid synthase
MRMSLRSRFLNMLRDRVAGDDLPLSIVLWDGAVFDFVPAPSVVIRLRSRRLLRHFLTGNIARLGQAYVAGELEVEGRLQDVLLVGVTIADRLGKSAPVRLLARLPHRGRHSIAHDAAAVRYHYDVSNDFYRLWLDRNMIYSCAYFETGEEDLDTAQEHKLDHICRKLRLQPGERLLDIGCGWGGLLCWAAVHYGVDGMYMPAMALAFDRNWLSVCQVIAQKRVESGTSRRALTRGCQYLPETRIRLSKGLDWGDL